MAVLVMLLVLAAAEGPEQDAPTWTFQTRPHPAGEVLRPCDPDGEAAKSLRAELERLHRDIRAIEPHQPVEKLVGRIAALTANPCFDLIRVPRLPTPRSGEELRWWWDRGGWQWLEWASELGRIGDGWSRTWVTPPGVRPSAPLSLAPLFCAENDPACGAGTRGWQMRADSWIELRQSFERRNTRTSAKPEECAAGDETGPDRFAAWTACVAGRVPRSTLHPLGRFRLPEQGWLVIAGRRGHYDFCDEIRAYSLSTGESWVASSCSGLALRTGGSVDFASTDAQRQLRVRSGRISVEALREALWSLALAGVSERVLDAAAVPVPEGMEILATTPSHDSGRTGSSGWFNTSQTLLRWSWIDDEKVLLAGELTWPDSSQPPVAYAAHLLAAAEASFREACVAAKPPVVKEVPAVNGRDADRAELPAQYEALRKALSEAAPKSCEPRTR